MDVMSARAKCIICRRTKASNRPAVGRDIAGGGGLVALGLLNIRHPVSINEGWRRWFGRYWPVSVKWHKCRPPFRPARWVLSMQTVQPHCNRPHAKYGWSRKACKKTGVGVSFLILLLYIYVPQSLSSCCNALRPLVAYCHRFQFSFSNVGIVNALLDFCYL